LRCTNKKVPHDGKEILHGYVELCTNKKERILQPRNRNAFASRKGASFNLSEGSLQKRKGTNTLKYLVDICKEVIIMTNMLN
jgi:hypothetical protein